MPYSSLIPSNAFHGDANTKEAQDISTKETIMIWKVFVGLI